VSYPTCIFSYWHTNLYLCIEHAARQPLGGKIQYVREWVSVIECIIWLWRDLYAYPSLSWV